MKGRETDANDPDGTALTLIRNAGVRNRDLPATDGDPLGAYPASIVAEMVESYNRVDPLAQTPLTAEDYALIAGDLARWIRDDRTGLRQIFDLVEARKRD